MAFKKFATTTSIFLIVVSLLASCTSNTSEKSAVREVTSSEAQIFSQILKNNYDFKNASFTITSAEGKKSNFTANGVVDWENERSAIEVSLTNQIDPDISAISTTELVYEKYIGLEKAETEVGIPSKEWVSREVNTRLYGVDSISQFVISLSATNAENPILLKQDGAQLVGTQESKGKTIYLFKKKNGTITYYSTEDSLLIAVSAKLEGFTGPVLISFSNFGNSSVTIPDAKDVNDSAYFPTYFNSRPKF